MDELDGDSDLSDLTSSEDEVPLGGVKDPPLEGSRDPPLEGSREQPGDRMHEWLQQSTNKKSPVKKPVQPMKHKIIQMR